MSLRKQIVKFAADGARASAYAVDDGYTAFNGPKEAAFSAYYAADSQPSYAMDAALRAVYSANVDYNAAVISELRWQINKLPR